MGGGDGGRGWGVVVVVVCVCVWAGSVLGFQRPVNRIGSTQDSGKWWGRGELRGGGREEKSSKTQTCVTLWFFKSCRLCRLLVLHAGSFFFFF